MHRLILFLLISFTGLASLSAQTAFSTSLNVGLVATSSPQYEAGMSALNLGLQLQTDHWSFALEAAAPMLPPAFTAQIPVTVRWHPAGTQSTSPYVFTRLRPILFSFIGCQSCEEFIDPENERPPTAFGGAGDIGLGYQFRIGKVGWLYLDGSYSIAFLRAREHRLDVPDNLYHGGLIGLGFAATL